MADNRYIALLRGINVGGNNIIKMADLKACFESMGYSDVKTYIQSGNVIFSTTEKDKAKITQKTEKMLSEKFNYNSTVVLITAEQLKQIVAEAPAGFGKEPEQYRYDVLFLKEPLTAAEAVKIVPVKDGVDNIYTGCGVLYFSRLISLASKSHLSKLIKVPVYKEITIRNWNTTTKLLGLVN